MGVGARCKQSKQSSSLCLSIIIIVLLVLAWGGGILMSRYQIPLSMAMLYPALLICIYIAMQRRTPAPTSQTEPAPEPAQKAELPFDNATSSSLDQFFAQQALSESHKYQLELLCSILELSTSAIILHNTDSDRSEAPSCVLHSIHTNNPQGINRQVDNCSGVLLSLKDDRTELTGHPSSPAFQGLPYYKDGTTVGGFMAITLKGIDEYHPLSTVGFLCVDRKNSTPWTEEEKNHIRNMAQKINIDLYVAEQLSKNNRDKKAINQICLALQDLNSVLNLQEAFEATRKTVTSLTQATIVAVTLKDATSHKVVSVAGKEQNLEGLIISDETSLVNQAMTLKRTMAPKGSQHHTPRTLFTSPSPLDSYKSLLIIPLIIEDNPIGTLIVGGEAAHLFTQDQQALLEMVAGQIATRIDLAQTHEKIHRMATIDGLTGLVNHRTFQNGLGKMIDRAKRQQTDVTLILCDIDHFKKVNDNYGHPFGDEVLRQVAGVLNKAVRSIDLAARYGGEEFTLVLENADTQGGIKLAERVRKEIEALQFFHEDQEVRVTMSFGISCYPALADNQTKLISQADQALYTCKEDGRNQTQCYLKEDKEQ